MAADESKRVPEDELTREVNDDALDDPERARDALHRRDQRDSFLLRLSDALRTLGDEAAILQTAARLLGEQLNAARAFFGELVFEQDLAIMHPDYTRDALPSLAGRFKISDFQETVDALATGQPLSVSDVATSELLSEQTRSAYLALGYASFFSVPLRSRGKVLSLSAVSERARCWTDAEIHLAQDVAERTWNIVERARAEKALRMVNDQLELRVRERTAEVNGLLTRLVRAQEEERYRIARAIHDQLGQQLSALRMNLDVLISRTEHDEALAEHASRTQRLAEQLDRSVDFLTWDLRPAALDDSGLAAALGKLVSGWSERFAIPAEFDAIETESLRLPRDVEANIYRVAQEALHNVLKHAHATHVAASLQRRDSYVVLVIEDNGSGFTGRERREKTGLGLLSMRERVALIGGTLDIESGTRQGTTLFVRVPISGLATRRA